MEDLRCRIATEIANAGSCVIHSVCQLLGRYLEGRKSLFLIMVILAVQTIEGTGMVKHGQVFVTVLRSF
jgi:hypothetical protein